MVGRDLVDRASLHGAPVVAESQAPEPGVLPAVAAPPLCGPLLFEDGVVRSDDKRALMNNQSYGGRDGRSVLVLCLRPRGIKYRAAPDRVKEEPSLEHHAALLNSQVAAAKAKPNLIGIRPVHVWSLFLSAALLIPV